MLNIFQGCYNLTEVTCYAEEPPSLGESCFEDIPSNAKLYVSNGLVDDYQDSEWSDYFISIRVIGDTSFGVGDTFTAANDDGVNITYMVTGLNPNTVMTYGYWDNDNGCTVTAIPSDYQGSLTIPETATYQDVNYTVTEIGEESFDAYELDLDLTEVTLPSTIVRIGDYAFDCCSSITKMTVLATDPPQLSDDSPFPWANNAKLYVPEGCVDVYQSSAWPDYFDKIRVIGAFLEEVGKTFVVSSEEGIAVTYQITSLDDGNDTGTVQLYGWYEEYEDSNEYPNYSYENAINNVELVTKLTIPSHVTYYIDDDEFIFTVTEVGDYAFLALKIPYNDWAAIVLPTGSDLYADATRCARIYLPSTITRIGKNAFNAVEEYSIGLRYVVLPDGVEEIDDYAFKRAVFLRELTLPKSLKRVGRSAFEDCSRLQKVTTYNPIPIQLPIWHNDEEADAENHYVFYRRWSNGPQLYVPYGSKYKYLKSNYWGFYKYLNNGYGGYFFNSENIVQMEENDNDNVTTIEPNDEYSTDFAEEMADGDVSLDDAVAGGVYYNLKSAYDNNEGCIVINNNSDMSGVSGDFNRAILVEKYNGMVVEVQGEGIVMIDCKTLGSGQLTVRIGDGNPDQHTQNDQGAISIDFDVPSPTPIYIYATVSGEQNGAPRRAGSAGDNCVNIYSLDIVPHIEFSISDVGMATFACNSPVDFTNLEDVVKVYYATYDSDEDQLTFHQIHKVPAHTGVLLVSTNNGAVGKQEVPPVLERLTDVVSDNVFVQGIGETVSYTDNNHDYILFNGENGLGFYKANKNRVAKDRAYIHLPSSSSANFFAINFDEEDGITTVEDGQPKQGNAQIYNLAGQRLNKLQRGLNIVNGKKVLVK